MLKRIALSVFGGIFVGFFPIAHLIASLYFGDEQTVAAFTWLAPLSFGAGFLCTMVLSKKHKEELER